MKLSAVTLTEGPIGICISVGLQQSENDDYAECAFLWLVNIISQYQLLDEFTRNFDNENHVPYIFVKHAFSERNWADCWKSDNYT